MWFEGGKEELGKGGGFLQLLCVLFLFFLYSPPPQLPVYTLCNVNNINTTSLPSDTDTAFFFFLFSLIRIWSYNCV